MDVEPVDMEGQPQRLSKDEGGGDRDHGEGTTMGKMKSWWEERGGRNEELKEGEDDDDDRAW